MATFIGSAVKRKEDLRFLTGRRQLHRRHQPPRPDPRLYRALAARPRQHQDDRHERGRERARRRRHLHRRRHAADKIGGLPCGWLIHSKDGIADGRAAAPAAGRRPRPPRRRSGRRGDRRNARPGQGRGRADQHRLSRSCRPSSSTGDAAKPGAPQVWDQAPGQHLLRLAPRRQGGDRRRVRQGVARHQDRPREQPADPQRDGAARRDRRLRPRDRRLHALHHQPEPARHPPA